MEALAAPWPGCRRALLAVALVGLAGCSAIGAFSEYEKNLIYKPKPATQLEKDVECSLLKAHYDLSLMILRERDRDGWEGSEMSRETVENDAWADVHRARRIGCEGWQR